MKDRVDSADAKSEAIRVKLVIQPKCATSHKRACLIPRNRPVPFILFNILDTQASQLHYIFISSFILKTNQRDTPELHEVGVVLLRKAFKEENRGYVATQKLRDSAVHS